MFAKLNKIILKIMLLAIRAYQLMLSPLIGNNCRFTPSCSQYFMEALKEHGILRGSYLGFKRIGKCHPWGKSGYDPVPKNSRMPRCPNGECKQSKEKV